MIHLTAQGVIAGIPFCNKDKRLLVENGDMFLHGFAPGSDKLIEKHPETFCEECLKEYNAIMSED